MKYALIALMLFTTPACAKGGQTNYFNYSQPTIMSEAEGFLGQSNPTSLRAPWCAAFVSMVLQRVGLRPLPTDVATSALTYGRRTSSPKPGDLVVMRRHVGFFVDHSGGGVRILSGNWGHRVAYGQISQREVVAYVSIN